VTGLQFKNNLTLPSSLGRYADQVKFSFVFIIYDIFLEGAQ